MSSRFRNQNTDLTKILQQTSKYMINDYEQNLAIPESTLQFYNILTTKPLQSRNSSRGRELNTTTGDSQPNSNSIQSIETNSLYTTTDQDKPENKSQLRIAAQRMRLIQQLRLKDRNFDELTMKSNKIQLQKRQIRNGSKISDRGKEEPSLSLKIQASGATVRTVTASNSSSYHDSYFPNGLEKSRFEKKELIILKKPQSKLQSKR